MASSIDTLLLPFETGALPVPAGTDKWGFFNATLLPDTDFDWKPHLIGEQRYFSRHMKLENAGYHLEHNDEFVGLNGALIHLHQARDVNEENFFKAWAAVRPGCPIVCVGTKKQGILSLRKRIGKQVSIAGSLSKYHAIVFWVFRDDRDWPEPALEHKIEGFVTYPGVFSADGPDKGSKMLVPFFDNRIRGRVGDFGAGWGYLSKCLTQKSDGIRSMDLYDHDRIALNAAKLNLENTGVEFNLNWCDVPTMETERIFDWIIMNPPFHAERSTEPDLGRQFIQKAAKSLKTKGHLLMVANRQLPYESELSRHFSYVSKLEEKPGFKVYEARLT